ncbi:MAG: hypothetical protein SOZ34_07090 [Clostridia bacterium]|nr:hypothetical protein [Clostridia bacterium]
MKKYFLAANTSGGYVNFYDETAESLKSVYTVTGLTDASASEVVKKLAAERGADELIINPMNVEEADGCIWREKGIGVFTERIKEKQANDENCAGIYRAYTEAKKIHDDWEKIYIGSMDTERLNSYSKRIISELLGENRGEERGSVLRRFFGASTSSKPINYINELTADMKARYFIKGRPGTGKSTFLKRLAKAAGERGFNTEIYYCSFDPKSLDMVVIPGLSLCVFDSTAPHELFPESERDEILDFYIEAGLEGVDERYEKELKMIESAYSRKMKEGVGFLKKIYEKPKDRSEREKEETVYKQLVSNIF